MIATIVRYPNLHRTHRIVISITLFCFYAVHCYALSAAKNLRQYVLRTWTAEQGLPQNTIHAVLQTRDGFLWIGTLGGLARFDGSSFVLYRAGISNSVPNDSITGLIEDRDGSLWISSAGGLTHYRDGHFHTYTSGDGLPETSIWRITADPAGGLWAVTWHSKLFHFDGASVRQYTTPIPALPEEVNALLEDSQGVVWFATFHGLFSFRRQQDFRSFTPANGLAGKRVFALALDHQGEPWCAGDGGLTHITSKRLIAVPVSGLSTATLLAFDTNRLDEAIWTGATGRGLFRMNGKRVERLQVLQGLTSDELWLLYFTRDGSLWLGAVDGLNQLGDGAVTTYETGEDLPRSTLEIQRAQGPEGELWFGSDRSLFYVNDAILVPLHPKVNVPGETTARPAVRETSDAGRGIRSLALWVHSQNPQKQGLIVTDGRGNALLSNGTNSWPLPAIPWSSVGTVLIDRTGTIWAGGSQIGVRAYPVHGDPHNYTTATGLDDNNVSALAEDASGNLWVGTLSGLNRIHNGMVTNVISCPRITSIAPFPDGSLWVSSEAGLVYVPRSLTPVRVFTRRDGLPTSIIEGVTQDDMGYLWLGTQQGIVRLNRDDMLSQDGYARSAVMFGRGDGFRNTQVRPNSVFRTRDGNVWFITLKELAMIEPRQTQPKPLAGIIIDDVDIDDQPSTLISGALLIVPAGRHRMRISYTLPEFRIPERLRFRYRLNGWDKSWIDAGTRREAIYTGIPPGHYAFEVDNSDGYGEWSTAKTTLSVSVTPYFYQTRWFVVLVSLLVIASLSQLHRLRVAQVSARLNAGMQERMQERARIARELHDTLLQGMLGISMQMYAASQQAFSDISVSLLLGRASQKLREIAEQGRKAVDDLRSPTLVPAPLEVVLALAFHEMNLPSYLQPQIHSAGARKNLGPLVQIEIEQIAREAVLNAVQHSGAKAIQVHIQYEPARFLISISDDGCGIDSDALKSGDRGHWGIAGMRERTKSIGGRFKIAPGIPHGTVVEVLLRGSVAYTEAPGGSIHSIWRLGIRR